MLPMKITKARNSFPHCSYSSSWASHFLKDKIKKQQPLRRRGGGRCVVKPFHLGSLNGCCNHNKFYCWLFNKNVDIEANMLSSPSRLLILKPRCCQALPAQVPPMAIATITTVIVGRSMKMSTFLSPAFSMLSN